MHQHPQQRRFSPVRSPSPAPAQQLPSRPNSNRWNTAGPAQEEAKPLTVFNNVAAADRRNQTPTPTPMNGRSVPVMNEVRSSPAPAPAAAPQKHAHVGSLYIPPVEPQDMYSNKQQQQQTTQSVPTPNWMQSRQTPAEEVPEWVNREQQHPQQPQQIPNGFPFAQKVMQQPPNTQHMYQEAVKQQQQQPARVIYQTPTQQSPQQRQAQTMQYIQNSSAQEQTTTTHRERIIPIQLEQTPSPSKCPQSPGFGPQPYYNMGQQQHSSVQSPGGCTTN